MNRQDFIEEDQYFESKTTKRTKTGFIIAFLLLLVGNLLSYWSTQNIKRQATDIQRTNKIIDGLENTLSFTIRAESSFRGYLVDASEKHHERLVQSIQKANNTIAYVSLLAKAGRSQTDKIEKIGGEMRQITAILHSNLDNLRSGNLTLDAVKENTAVVDGMVTKLEDNIQSIQQTEKTIAQQHSKKASGYVGSIRLFTILSTLIAILLTLYSFLVFNTENKAKKEADKKAGVYRDKLEAQVKKLADMNSELVKLRSLEKFTSTGRIARTMAHEVRNPLTNINLAVEQLKAEVNGSEDGETFLSMIERNSERVNKIVSNLLNATKLAELDRKPTSINELLDECLDDAADRIELKHINVEKKYNVPICTVKVDKPKLKIAFLNFIVNGVEAMEKGGTLTVSTDEEEGHCIVKIKDTGEGMSQETLDRLFEPFFSTKKNGNGLGLANSHNIIISHQGHVSVDSHLGEGTTFTISLDF